MSKNINSYLPKVLQPILEFQIINNDLDVELDSVDAIIKNINKETIVQTATVYGIERWEKSLKIIPGIKDTLEIRRFRIQNILNNKLPYTLRWLENKLTQITGSVTAWTISLNYDEYVITITLSELNTGWMTEIQKQLRSLIPANMELEIGGEAISGADILIGTGVHIGYKLRFNS